MTCREFDRWLDEGMAEAASASVLAHARACPRCAAMLEAARALEAALQVGATPTRAPARFTSGVMARVHEAESIRAREAVDVSGPRRWIAILADPVTTVSLTFALLVLAVLVWNPAWLVRTAGSWGARWLQVVTRAGEMPVDRTVWLALLVAATPLTLWFLWVVGRSLERTLVLHVTRPHH